jgi:CBS domain-containing protein
MTAHVSGENGIVNIENILLTARERLVTISHKAQLVQAATLLGNSRNDLIVACEDTGRMVGVVTRRDIVSRIGQCQGRACTASVASVMSRDVIYCGPTDTLEATWGRMKRQGYMYIPIIDHERRPLGTLSARDVLQILLGETEHEEYLLRDYVMGIGYR